MVYDDGGVGGGESRVRESEGGDRIDRRMGSLFGLRRICPPEKFSGGGATVAGGGRWWPEKMSGRENSYVPQLSTHGLMIDVAHLKGLYKGTSMVAVAMDGNNQIVPIAFGICKGDTGPCWSWWILVLKECIDDNLNLLFISDRHHAIAMAVENEFPLAFHAVYCRHLMQNLSLKNKKEKVYSGKYARHTHKKTMQPA
ncbi:transposase, MuDR, MULE transposase domain protein [Tanacetum coccineum]